jgi:hypothetical protein
MPATKAKPAPKATKAAAKQAKAIAAAVKPSPKVKPAKRKQEPAPPTRSELISAAMLELAEVRKVAREKRGGTPCKWLLFDEWFKALLAMKPYDLDAAAKKFPEVKATTVKAWRNKWRNGRLPSNGRGKEAQIAKAIAKGAVA